MLFLDNKKIVRAGDVQVGDMIDHDKNVTHIEVVKRRGLYAPVTESGDIMVSGVRASSYVALIDVAPTFQAFATHALMTPRRLACSVRFSSCENEEYNEDGLSKYLVPMIQAAAYVAKLNLFMQLLLILMSFPLLIFLLALEHLTRIPELIVVLLLSFLAKNFGRKFQLMLTRCQQREAGQWIKSLA
jgi:hypothetical protein